MEKETFQKLPPFTRALLTQAEKRPVSFATPGHRAGDFYRKTEAGRIFCEALSEHFFAADLSDSDDAIGNVNAHEGFGFEAEALAACVFHADQTFFVLGGTSAANRIACAALLSPGDTVLIAGHNHQSMVQAIAETGARAVFLPVLRNEAGIVIGTPPECLTETYLRRRAARVSGKKTPKKRPYRLACFPLVTYDGVFLSPRKILETVGPLCDYILFDAAWGGYEAFLAEMKDFSPLLMPLSEDAPGILVTQSVHKQLAGFTQTSQLHIRDAHLAGKKRRLAPDVLAAAFSAHVSTSPSAPLFAGLEMNAAIHEEAGEALWEEAAQMGRFLKKEMETRLHRLRPFSAENFGEGTEEWYRPDPCKIFLETRPAGIYGGVLDAYLQKRGIVPEKSSPQGVLFLISPADTKEQYETLLTALCDFETAMDTNVPISDIFPQIMDEDLSGGSLSVLGGVMLDFLTIYDFWDSETECFAAAPKMKLTPREARDAFVSGKARLVSLKEAVGRIAVESAGAYPPGIPVVFPGTRFTEEAVRYLDLLSDFNRVFPEFPTELHGVRAGNVWVL